MLYDFSGIPGMPVFGPNVTEIEPSKFLLEWATPSFSNILEHSLIYKQVKVIYHSKNLFGFFLPPPVLVISTVSCRRMKAPPPY